MQSETSKTDNMAILCHLPYVAFDGVLEIYLISFTLSSFIAAAK